jgi:hypothetical protein
MAQFTEDEKIMRRLEQRFNKGVVKYRLIEDGDKILIGLSGGKDSLALLELLARRSRILKPKFTVIAVHVGMTNIPYQSDLEYLKGYSEDLGVPFVHYETFFEPRFPHPFYQPLTSKISFLIPSSIFQPGPHTQLFTHQNYFNHSELSRPLLTLSTRTLCVGAQG